MNRLLLTILLIVLPASLHAQYKLTDGAEVAPLDMFQECDVCPEMIVLPLGDFTMGGPIGDSINRLVVRDGKLALAELGDPAIGADERPLHRVEIDIPIAMGRNEITYDQWMACVEDGGCGGHIPENVILMIDEARKSVDIPVLGNHPVIDVSYLDAEAYVAWLNVRVGTDAYRLPTEAEWEYAARAGTQTRFAQGDELTSNQADFLGSGTEDLTGVPRPDLLSRRVPVPVDELDAANQWGLRHMSGNVVERTRSCTPSATWDGPRQANGCARAW